MKSLILKKLLAKGRKGNPLDRIGALESKSNAAFFSDPSVEQLSDITDDAGRIVSGEFISPAAEATSTEPTDTGFTGAAMGGNGWTFASTIYHLVAVAAGVLQAGFNAAGKFIAGAGAVTIDADGITVTSGSSGGSIINIGQSLLYDYNGTLFLSNINFSSSDARGVYISARNTFTTSTIDIAAQTDNGYIRMDTGDNQIRIDTVNGITINYLGVDCDTLIKGSATTIATFDAGLEALGLGGAAESGYKLKTTGATRTTGNALVEGFLGLGAAGALTISGGIVTATKSFHSIDTEGGAASDDLDTINGGSEGDILILKSTNNARDVVCKDGTGNLNLAGDFTLSHVQDTITLINLAGTAWRELSRSDNAA